MEKSPRDRSAEKDREWKIQECFFGSSIYPGDVKYRSRGEIVQEAGKFYLETYTMDGRIRIADVHEVEAYLSSVEDWEFKTSPYRQEGEAFRHYVEGWVTLTSPEDLERYRSDVEKYLIPERAQRAEDTV